MQGPDKSFECRFTDPGFQSCVVSTMWPTFRHHIIPAAHQAHQLVLVHSIPKPAMSLLQLAGCYPEESSHSHSSQQSAGMSHHGCATMLFSHATCPRPFWITLAFLPYKQGHTFVAWGVAACLACMRMATSPMISLCNHWATMPKE